MNDVLFKIDYKTDKNWIPKEFFNAAYEQGSFEYTVSLLVRKTGTVINRDRCLFPDFDDPDPEGHFKGVKFGIYGNPPAKPGVSEVEFSRYEGILHEEVTIHRQPDHGGAQAG